jgi:hypothetical protein
MKNKYYLANKKEARMERINSFIMNEFCIPLQIPKMIIKAVKKYIKNKRYKFAGHQAVYNHLIIPDKCFKSSNSIMRTY